jgi:outer membrane protein insertion porin family
MKLGIRLIHGLSTAGFVLGSSLFGFIPVIAPAGIALAQTAASITVEGNRRVEAGTVRSYFKPGPDGRLGPLQIDEAYKSLIGTGLFQDVRINTAGGRIHVVVVENAVINRIAFEGNSRVKDEQLKLEVQSKERGTLSRPQVQSDVQRIVEIYRRSGRFDVAVDPKIIELPNGRVDLVFEIRPISNRSSSSVTGRFPRIACAMSSRPPKPHFFRSCRPATSTTRIALRLTASCCGGSI